jgi:hypothetical protein
MPYFSAGKGRFCIALFVLVLLGFITGCGSSSSVVTTVAVGTFDVTGTVFTAQTAVSLQQTQYLQLATQIKDQKGNILTAPVVTWSSSNPQVVSITPQGEICAGTWDANYINCNPGAITSSTPVTITASSSGKSASLSVSVHSRIAKVTLSMASSPACLSQTQTLQYSLRAFDANGNDITSSSGTPIYSATDATVATIDANGLATAKNPGATPIVGSLGGVTSTPLPFVTCPPKSIVLHQSGDAAGTTTTNFTIATGATVNLVADVTDTQGNPVTGLPLTYSIAQPAVASISTTTLTGSNVGFTTVVASCAPPGCNPSNNTNAPGTGQVAYSNLVDVNVTGTAAATTIYVTGATAADGSQTNTSLIPISMSTNTAGTALTLPAVPNSMAISPKGDNLYVGTVSGLVIVATSSNTVSAAASGAPGKILAVSPTGTQVVLDDTANTRILLFDNSNSSSPTVRQILSSDANTAAFSPDGYKLFLGANGAVYEFTATSALGKSPFASQNVTAVAATPQGAVTYVSPTGTNQISSIATCNNALITNPTVSSPPSLMQALPDGSQLVGISATNWMLQPYTVTSGFCPPTVNDSNGVNQPTYAGATPTQLLVSPSPNYAFVMTSTSAAAATTLNFLNLQNGSTGQANLASGTSGTPTTGGFSLDGTQLWVGLQGGSGNSVHRFDLTQNPPSDAAQISVGFPPQFVVVQP